MCRFHVALKSTTTAQAVTDSKCCVVLKSPTAHSVTGSKKRCGRAYMAAQDVLLQLLRVKLLVLCAVTHEPLVTMGNVQPAIKCTLQARCITYCIYWLELVIKAIVLKRMFVKLVINAIVLRRMFVKHYIWSCPAVFKFDSTRSSK